MTAAPQNEAWNGMPTNPEKDGAHAITDACAFWDAGRQRWLLLTLRKPVTPEWLASQSWAEYHGPLFTQAQMASLAKAGETP